MTSRSEHFTTPALMGVHLHALHWGDEAHPKLVMLHGGGANAHWWDHVAPDLAERWHVIALDFRGHGDSDHPEALIPGAFNDDLEALLVNLGDPGVALLGHSMGGGVALAHAAGAMGNRALALIAVDVSRGASKRARRGARLALALRRKYASRQEAIDRYRFLPATEHASDSLRKSIAEHSIRREADGRFSFKFDPRWFSIPGRPRPPLSRIACPTLVLRGSESLMLTQEGANELAAEIPNAITRTIQGAGHHIQLDQPEAFFRAVDTFLETSGG